MDLAQLVYDVARFHCWLLVAFVSVSFFLALIVEFFGKKKARGFFVMTLVWVFIHLVVALLLFNHIRLPEPAVIEYVLTHILKWIRVNILLDLFYGICGMVLIWQSRLRLGWSDYLWGFGVAVLVQCGGLLVMDLTFFYRINVLFNAYLAATI
jgi:hypothetical protein